MFSCVIELLMEVVATSAQFVILRAQFRKLTVVFAERIAKQKGLRSRFLQVVRGILNSKDCTVRQMIEILT